MRVADIMIPNPVCVSPDETLNGMMNLMDRHGFRHLPVVENDTLTGIVSQRDLLSATGWLPAPPDSPLRARDVLSSAVATLSAEDSLVTLTLELELRSVGCLPVVDGRKLVGIVTETDVLAACLKFLQEDPPVTAVMSAAPITVTPDASLRSAEARASEAGVRHLPVMEKARDGERLVGILSDRDFRRVHGRQQLGDLPVGRVMTAIPLVVDAAALVSEAADHLITHRVGALPVVNGEQTVGIVSISDLLEHCENHLRDPQVG